MLLVTPLAAPVALLRPAPRLLAGRALRDRGAGRPTSWSTARSRSRTATSAWSTGSTRSCPTAIREVSAHAGGRPVHVVGWSLGGIFALLTAADQPDLPIASLTVRRLARSTSPWCRWWRRCGRCSTSTSPQAPGRDHPRLPGPWAAPRSRWCAGRSSCRRSQKLVTKPLAIADHLDDADFLAQLEAVDRFTDDMIAYPGRTFGQLYHRFVKGNALASGPIDLRRPHHRAVRDHRAGAGLRRRHRRHRPDRGRQGRRAAADRLRGGPLRDRPRRPPRHAHRPRRARHDLAGHGRVDRPVVGGQPPPSRSARPAPAPYEPHATRSAPTRTAATARPVRARSAADPLRPASGQASSPRASSHRRAAVLEARASHASYTVSASSSRVQPADVGAAEQHRGVPVEVRRREERRRLVEHQRLLRLVGLDPEDDDVVVALAGLGVDRVRARVAEEDEAASRHLVDGLRRPAPASPRASTTRARGRRRRWRDGSWGPA